MDSSKILIVGIDPGTTTGIAALDFNGNLVASISKKGLGHTGIVKTIEKLGTPVIISTDISPPPQKVAKVAAAFSVRLVWPVQSLTKKEKTKIFKEYFKKQDIPVPPWKRHQKDSLVAAVFAWKAFRSLILKIMRKIEHYKNMSYYNRMERYVQMEVFLRGKSLESAIKDFFKKEV